MKTRVEIRLDGQTLMAPLVMEPIKGGAVCIWRLCSGCAANRR
jgi:hypothetical protein